MAYVSMAPGQPPPPAILLTARQVLDRTGNAAASHDRATQDALMAAARYVSHELTQSHDRLGRSGPVCPYVAAALRNDLVTFTVSPLREPDMPALAAQVEALRANFAAPAADDFLRAIVLVFPYLSVEAATPLVATLQRDLKQSFVERGLMLGEFYPGCPVPGVHAPEFRPLDTPFCMLAMRRMTLGDVLFTVDSDRQIQSYLNHFGEPGAGMLRRLLARGICTPERRSAILRLLDRDGVPA